MVSVLLERRGGLSSSMMFSSVRRRAGVSSSMVVLLVPILQTVSVSVLSTTSLKSVLLLPGNNENDHKARYDRPGKLNNNTKRSMIS